MTPQEFADLQRALLDNAAEHNRLLKRIGDNVGLLAWGIIIALILLVSTAGILGHH